MLLWLICYGIVPRTAELILRPSTWLVLGNLLSWRKELRHWKTAGLSQLLIQPLHISLRPPDGRKFYLALCRNHKDGRHVREAIGVGDRILAFFIQQRGEG